MEKDEIKASKMAETQDDTRVYELGYILVSSLPEDKVASEVEVLSDLVIKNTGSIISSEMPILIDLAYSMLKVVGTNRQKYTRGYFGWIKFEGTTEGLLAIKKVLDLSPLVLRYMIVKTTRENTLLHGKMVLRQEEQEGDEAVVEEDAEVVLPETLPEVDKLLDDTLVIA